MSRFDQSIIDAPHTQREIEQAAHDHRSFPEAADGRPMPPMGDELMTAGLNADDARFVAIQLAQNGLTLVPDGYDDGECVGATGECRYWREVAKQRKAERDALKAEVERLRGIAKFAAGQWRDCVRSEYDGTSQYPAMAAEIDAFDAALREGGQA